MTVRISARKPMRVFCTNHLRPFDTTAIQWITPPKKHLLPRSLARRFRPRASPNTIFLTDWVAGTVSAYLER